eukprot:TRINITY_DN1423_c0_g1_i1.p1 TRINITY_DN1423_c0_g1~~TRINITY_DN1423_c0_g1_i1.p1  ORF type:complete len:167 (-),score=12.80 TRINITY_DN1423_c0_g1_i1:268-768(-)
MLRFVWKRHQKSPAKNFSVVRYKHDLYSGWTTASYWDSFYQEKVDSKRLKKNNFEWFVSKVDCLVDHLLPHLPTSGNILHIGCGTSELGIRLYQRGFRNIHGIDISATAVEEMKRHASVCDRKNVSSIPYFLNSFFSFARIKVCWTPWYMVEYQRKRSLDVYDKFF